MTQQLREELTRIGQDAPHLDLPEDLWSHGRRARRRGRVLAAAAVACLVLALGGLTTVVVGGPPRVLPAGPAPGAPGMPRLLHPVPEHVQQDDAAFSSTLAVGPSAAAFLTGTGVPVTVSATDGSYRLLRLPGWRWADSDGVRSRLDPASSQSLGLSPDGTRLAYGWVAPTPPGSSAPASTGVRVVDLRSGDLMTHRVTGLDGAAGDSAVVVRAVTWSPDGRWVAWSGSSLESWDETGIGSEGGRVLGRFAPREAGSAMTATGQAGGSSLTVTDDGTLVEAGRSGSVVVHDPRGRTSEFVAGARGLDASPLGAASPDGSRVALAVAGAESPVDVLDLGARRLGEREPPGGFPFGPYTRPVGWLDETTVLLVNDDDGWQSAAPKLHLLSVPKVPRERYRARAILRAAPADGPEEAAQYLSVAVDLVTNDRLAVDRPEPEWPWSPERRATVGAVSGAVLLLGGVLLWWRRRAPL